MMARANNLHDLEQKLGYRFRDRALLANALTHASVRGQKNTQIDNERLEFIGDRVLGLAVAELLIEALPKANEGDLARHYNRLVRGETCALVARDIGLGAYLILSDSEAESGGRDKETILADAMEALLGALFLEAGFSGARDRVRALWADHVADFHDAAADAKTALQEWAQGQGLALPVYVEVAREGPDHAPKFTAEVRLSGRAPTRGDGPSKRAAEQSAAAALLVREGVRAGPSDDT
jgi:ribonuclease-3